MSPISSFLPSRQGQLPTMLAAGRRWATALAAAALLAACSPDVSNQVAQAEPAVPAPISPTALAQPAPAFAAAKRKSPGTQAASAKEASFDRQVQAETAASVAAAGAAPPGRSVQPATQRYLAVQHHLQIEAPAAELARLWEAVKTACENLDCYVEGSALQRETAQSAAAAYLTMRVNPRDFAMLTAALGGHAKVLNHQTSTEDKTSQVIDIEAQIKNRSEYRDSLRELLRERNVKRTLQDLMEIRDTMSQVQAEIDAASTQRALLERETAKQLVQMGFQPARVIVSGTYSPWQQTWQHSWDRLTRSVQGMILGSAELLPWLIVLGLVAWPVVAVWRRKRAAQQARRSASEADAPSETGR